MKTNSPYDDHDDAHFDGNPAYRKTTARNRKKVSKDHAVIKGNGVGNKQRVGGLTKPAIAAQKIVTKKPTRKRVAGK
jgi:hypothetical protein